MIISSRRKLLSLNDYTVTMNVDGVQVNQTTHSKSLGPNIDNNLSWEASIHDISRVRLFVSMHTAVKIYKGLIEPHLYYCSAVWDGLFNRCVINTKNYKVALSELSVNQAMALVPDNF